MHFAKSLKVLMKNILEQNISIIALCSTILGLGSLFEKALNQLGNDLNDVIPPLNIYWKVVRSLSHSSG